MIDWVRTSHVKGDDMPLNRRHPKKLHGPARAHDDEREEIVDSPATAHPVEDGDMLKDPALTSINEGEEPQNVPPGI
jgi:hypothetical protein